MLVVGFFIASSTFYTAGKMYRKRKQQKELASFLAPEQNGKTDSLPAEDQIKTSTQKYKPGLTRGLSGDRGDEQLIETPSVTVEESDVYHDENRVNRYLTVSLISLGLTTVGRLSYTAFSLLGVSTLIYVIAPFVQRGYKSLFKERKIDMTVVDFFAVPGMLITGHLVIASLTCSLLYTGFKLVLRTEANSRHNLIDVFGEIPRFVWLLVDEGELRVPFETIETGDIVVVNAGETIPVDGIITDGIASIDQHMLTGESQPAEKGPGDPVFALTIVLSGRIHVQVEKAGKDTVAAQIGDILNRTADYKSSIQSRGIEMSDRSALPTLALGALALPLTGVIGTLAVLSSGLGYNMRIIAPLSVLNFLNVASQSGILIKDGRALERLREVDTIVFDKTGTLTEVQPHVGQIYTFNGDAEDVLLTYCAAAEYKQTHPIARAILEEAKARHLTLPPIEDAEYELGYGLKVKINGKIIRVGSVQFMEMASIVLPPEVQDIQECCSQQGSSLVLVSIDNQLGGAIELRATIRPEMKAVLKKLRQHNLSTYIVSGDQEGPTQQLARELGIDHAFAEALPEDKADLIEQLQAEGKSVCFVGDGINDSIALKKAQVSVSMRGAATIATDTAQVVLMDGDLNQLAHLFDLAKNLEHNMKVNLATTIIPGAICIGGVFFLHFGMGAALVLYNAGLVAGVCNAMLPGLNRPKAISAAHDVTVSYPGHQTFGSYLAATTESD